MSVLHRLSLAAGVLADREAADVAAAAVESGFRNVGFTVKPWGDHVTRQLRSTLEPSAVRVLDVEVVRIAPDGSVSDDDRHIVDVGGTLGAENVLIISNCADVAATADALAGLAEQAAGYGMRACLEFMRFTKVPTLASAREVLRRAAHPAAGLLIDTLHLARTGELDEVREVAGEHLPYAQFCDGLATCGDDDAALIADALDDRSPPGDGELPLSHMLDALPEGIPLSLEVRSRVLRETYPDPVARATHLLERTRAFLNQMERTHDG